MSFNNVPDPEMIAKSAAVTVAFTPERYAYLLSLLPTPESYIELHNRFEGSYAASLKGDPAKVKACEADRLAINKNLSILLGVAKAAALNDPNVPEALGLGSLTGKTAAWAGALTEPHEFKVVYTPKGQIRGSVARVAGAKGYQIWLCDSDPNLEANWRLVASSPNCKGIAITGLNRGKPNWLKIRAMRGNNAGPWSNLVSLQA